MTFIVWLGYCTAGLLVLAIGGIVGLLSYTMTADPILAAGLSIVCAYAFGISTERDMHRTHAGCTAQQVATWNDDQDGNGS